MTHCRTALPWLRSSLAGAIVLVSIPAHAITWDFATPGDAQGWTARMALASAATYLRPLRSEVTDGHWVVHPAEYEPNTHVALELVSPRLRHDPSLFDRVVVDLRVVHPEPIVGSVYLSWTTPGSAAQTGAYPDTVYAVERLGGLFSGEWQSVQFTGLQARTYTRTIAGHSYEAVLGWEGELLDVRVGLRLSAGQAATPADIPEAILIERIVLTGPEEMLQGELPPPASGGLAFGDLFAAPLFCPLRLGLGEPVVGYWGTQADLGDLDGDGDLDLVAVWVTSHARGWVEAYNDGAGLFAHPLQPHGLTVAAPEMLGLCDLDQDGAPELLAGGYPTAYILRRTDEGAWETASQHDGVCPLGTADVDGDGQQDVLLPDLESSSHTGLRLLLSRPGGLEEVFVEGDPEAGRSYPMRIVRRASPVGADGVIWQPPVWELRPDGSGYSGFGKYPAFAVSSFDEQVRPTHTQLAVELDIHDILWAGDVDADGDVDVVVNDVYATSGPAACSTGMTCLANEEGWFTAVAWAPDVRLRTGEVPEVLDLDGDGRLDVVFCDTDLREPAVVVGRGQPGTAALVPEGRYPLEGSGGQVLPRDVDNDGDIDLVVCEPAHYDAGGVHVLLSRLADGVTAVSEETAAALPLSPVLHANYPNPFNPTTTLAFSLPAVVASARLEICNALGQRVRTLLRGPVSAGRHELTWNGMDADGHELPSGVYVAWLKADGWTGTRKMVKAR